MRVKSDFRLLTEEAFRGWLLNRPDMRRYHFEGYCTLTQNQVEFDAQHISVHNCDNCYPESHFIMVPNELWEENH